jgi:hypothetical protein
MMHGQKSIKLKFQYYIYDTLLSAFGLINCLNHVKEQSILIVIPQIRVRARKIFRIIVSISSFTNDANEIRF